jgi:hypothetical protein
MENNTKKPDFNYRSFEFNAVFEKSFETFKNIFAQTGVIILLYVIIQIVVLMSIQNIILGINIFDLSTVEVDLTAYSLTDLLTVSFFNSLLAGLTTPLLASIYPMCKHYMQHKSQPPINAFDNYQNPFFTKIFAFAFGLSITTELISLLFTQLEIGYVGTIIVIPIMLLTVLTIPILIFNNLNVADSITLSSKIISKQPFLVLLLLIVAVLFAMVGFLALCIGIIFTMPFIYIMIYHLYEYQFPANHESEIDTIGIE